MYLFLAKVPILKYAYLQIHIATKYTIERFDIISCPFIKFNFSVKSNRQFCYNFILTKKIATAIELEINFFFRELGLLVDLQDVELYPMESVMQTKISLLTSITNYDQEWH